MLLEVWIRSWCKDNLGGFQRDPPPRLAITRIKVKFETNGTVQNVNEKRFGRPRPSTTPTTQENVANISPKSKKICAASESWNRYFKIVCPTHFVVKRSFLERVVPAFNDGDPDRRGHSLAPRGCRSWFPERFSRTCWTVPLSSNLPLIQVMISRVGGPVWDS